MNPNYEILEQLLRLDADAGAATVDWRNAQKQLFELAKKTKICEDTIAKTKVEMAYLEGELRRQFRKVDELEERKTDKAAKLFAAKNDDEHRGLKREVDNVDRELKDFTRRTEDTELKIESLKTVLGRTGQELAESLNATEDERKKAENSESKSSGRISELAKVRDGHLEKLDDRVSQHYTRLAKITKNPSGPVTRVSNGSCGNCHMKLAPQLLNTIIKSKDIEFCPSCNHILLPVNQA